MAELFGFKITRSNDDKPELRKQSFVTPVSDDGAATIAAGGYYGTYVDLEGTAKSEVELISRYRDISQYSECSSAIDDIVTESIANVDTEKPVEIDIDSLTGYSDQLKNVIKKEFEEVIRLLDFNSRGSDIFRRWYIDGRLYYQKVVDVKTPKKGIQELRYIDPRRIRKVREVKKEKLPNGIDVVTNVNEFYIYTDKGTIASNAIMPTSNNTAGIKIAPDTITYVTSGLIDLDKNLVLGYLHKAIKPVNQLRMMEDSLVIYRMSRAPERRIFYIDVGNLPKVKAEQYLKDVMNRYRNKIVYDSSTGEIKDDRKVMSMLEDFWLPRRDGGKGTEISTLPGGENLGQIDDVTYFQNKLYKSLNVPISRLQTEQAQFNFGRQAEITRDEIKFAKFVTYLQLKFSELFIDLLKTQLLLKAIITEQDWDQIKQNLKFEFAKDQYFEEAKKSEGLRNRIDVLNQMQQFVGIYFSREYVMKNVLQFSEDEIKEIQQQIAAEPPLLPVDPAAQPTQ